MACSRIPIRRSARRTSFGEISARWAAMSRTTDFVSRNSPGPQEAYRHACLSLRHSAPHTRARLARQRVEVIAAADSDSEELDAAVLGVAERAVAGDCLVIELPNRRGEWAVLPALTCGILADRQVGVEFIVRRLRRPFRRRYVDEKLIASLSLLLADTAFPQIMNSVPRVASVKRIQRDDSEVSALQLPVINGDDLASMLTDLRRQLSWFDARLLDESLREDGKLASQLYVSLRSSSGSSSVAVPTEVFQFLKTIRGDFQFDVL